MFPQSPLLQSTSHNASHCSLWLPWIQMWTWGAGHVCPTHRHVLAASNKYWKPEWPSPAIFLVCSVLCCAWLGVWDPEMRIFFSTSLGFTALFYFLSPLFLTLQRSIQIS